MTWDRLRCVAAPAVAPLSLDDAKAHLDVESEHHNQLIEGAIAAAVGDVDGPHGIGLCMIEQTWKLTLDRFIPRITIPLAPVLSIVSVEYVATDGTVTTLAPDRYSLKADLDPPWLVAAYGSTFPTTRAELGAVRITFKAGYGPKPSDVPADLVQAIKLIVRSRYDDPANGGVPPAARAILDRYAVLAVF